MLFTNHTLPRCAAEVLPHIPRDPCKWTIVLDALLEINNPHHGKKDKGVSYKTMQERRNFLYTFFRDLRDDPQHFRIDPRSLGRRHVEHAVNQWKKRGLSAGTIQNYLSILRVFSAWIGKAGLVAPSDAYFKDDPTLIKRTYRATRDKSWAANGVDVDAVIAEVDQEDPRVGAQLRMCDAFGLRVKEALMLRPHMAVLIGQSAVVKGETYETYLEVLRGTKGGRLRHVPIINDRQHAAIQHACTLVTRPTESLADPSLKLQQAERRFYKVVGVVGITKKKLGVTVHGLRHGFAHRRYQDKTGSPVPIAGGGSHDRAADHKARMTISKELGHARKGITSAYLGHMALQIESPTKMTDPSPPETK
jgi:integrase